MKLKKKKGFSLVELCIVLVVMSLIATLSVSLLSVSVRGFNASRQMMDVTMQDADFASRICSAVRESGTAFTIPEQSFTEDKLTAGWNYLGLMHGVDIPAEMSRTGRAVEDADALVYIEYAGDTPPATLPQNSVLLHTADGYFIQTIIGHSYTDVSGVVHDYSLVFSPTDPSNRAAQTLSYSFSSTTSRDGVETAGGNSIETLLEAVNAIQVVYQGSAVNPATAIAFRSDFLPTLSANSVSSNQVRGTVIMVLDVSSSMTATNGSESRISTLKSTARSFVEELSKNNELNILITIFAGFANKSTDFDTRICPNPCTTLANAFEERDRLMATIDSIKTSQYTNLGDGLRVVYHELNRHPEVANDPIFLLVLTDGEVNTSTCVKKSSGGGGWYGYGYGYGSYGVTYTQSDFYLGEDIYNGSSFENKYVCNYQSDAKLGRQYYQYFGGLINEKYAPKTYLISMYNGMSRADKQALQAVFTESEAFDASTLTQFTEVFEQINQNISASMWAFEGPRL